MQRSVAKSNETKQRCDKMRKDMSVESTGNYRSHSYIVTVLFLTMYNIIIGMSYITVVSCTLHSYLFLALSHPCLVLLLFCLWSLHPHSFCKCFFYYLFNYACLDICTLLFPCQHFSCSRFLIGCSWKMTDTCVYHISHISQWASLLLMYTALLPL